MVPNETLVGKIARAIATQEGFYVPGSRPARNHNPGDLKADLTGKATGKDEGGIVIYATDADGWEALYRQVENFYGGSILYNPSMSIIDTARIYAPFEASEWANGVASQLRVTINTRWEELVT